MNQNKSEHDQYGYFLCMPQFSDLWVGYSDWQQDRVLEYNLPGQDHVTRYLCNVIDQFSCPDTMLDLLSVGIVHEIDYTQNKVRALINFPKYTENFPCSDGYWVSPNGEVYSVGFVGHSASAKEILATYYGKHWRDPEIASGYGSVDYLESLNWIHISGGSVYVKNTINDKQYDTLRALITIAPHNVVTGIEHKLFGSPNDDDDDM